MAYSNDNSIGVVYIANSTDGTATTNYPLLNIGSGGNAGRYIYEAEAGGCNLIITGFWVLVCAAPSTSTAPVLKFWRRPNAGVAGSEVALYKSDGTTQWTLTIPTSSPTPIVGDVYRLQFPGGLTINPGESMVVETDVLGNAATTAHMGHTGYFERFGGTEANTTGIAKTETSAIGKVYTVTA